MRRIYVDLDDVLAQTGRMFLGVLAREFGREVAFEEIRSYHLGESFRLDAGELAEFMRLAHEPEALARVEPMPGAVATLNAWRQRAYEIFVVTGRPPATRAATLAWLRRYAVPYDEFHFLDKYSQFYDRADDLPAGTLTLADLPELEFCLAIEDFADTALHLARTLGVPVALFDRPWNQAVGEGGGARIVRCRDWREVRRRFPAP